MKLNCITYFSVLVTVLLISSCSSPTLDYQALTPRLDLNQYFQGKTKAYGVVTGFNDELKRRFEVDIIGTRKDGMLILDEYFTFDDGEQDFRRWQITQIDTNNYQGKADDIIDSAQGSVAGPVLNWQYQMMLAVDNTEYKVTFDDTMILLDDKRLLNRAKIKKFGITVANVIIFFEKIP
jgi:hypothetical protein